MNCHLRHCRDSASFMKWKSGYFVKEKKESQFPYRTLIRAIYQAFFKDLV
jgi:hypothetical protein